MSKLLRLSGEGGIWLKVYQIANAVDEGSLFVTVLFSST